MTTTAWLLTGGLCALACATAYVGLLARARRREVARLERVVQALGERVGALEERSEASSASRTEAARDGEPSYVITDLVLDTPSPRPEPVVPGTVDPARFADTLAKESAVRAAGLVHGLRRALSPEVRHRIRFEMRQEAKRARSQRRADLKAALRDLRARERAAATPSTATAEGDAA